MIDVLAKRKLALSRKELRPSPSADYDELPNLSKLMAGVPSADGKSWDIPPHSLTLWLDGEHVKIVVGAGDEFPKFFGTILTLASGLQGVEQALTTPTGEWKEPKGLLTGLTTNGKHGRF